MDVKVKVIWTLGRDTMSSRVYFRGTDVAHVEFTDYGNYIDLEVFGIRLLILLLCDFFNFFQANIHMMNMLAKIGL